MIPARLCDLYSIELELDDFRLKIFRHGPPPREGSEVEGVTTATL